MFKYKPNKKGLFVTFEGGEGAGKTTLIASLQDRLGSLGFITLITREPGGSPLGVKIRQLLLHQADIKIAKRAELLLFLADRAQHVEEVILPSIDSGKIVLCDRFTDSTIAYQGTARAISRAELDPLLTFGASNLHPDITFYLDIDPEIGLARAGRIATIKDSSGFDRFEAEKLEFHQKVREGFLAEAKAHPHRIVTLNAHLSKEEVLDYAWKHLEKLLDMR